MRHLIGERLASARKRAGLSQEELALRIGTQGWTVSRYETGRMFPRLPMLRRLSRLLQVSTDYLLGLEREPALLDRAADLPGAEELEDFDA